VIGEALYFDEGGQELITSVLASIERPTREVVASYERRVVEPVS
jgi:hypothetical protein